MDELRVSGKPEFSVYSHAACDMRLVVSLRAPEAMGDKRAPISVSLVLDRSGSMAGSKLKLVKKTSAFLVSQLKATDQLGCVSYDDEVQVPIELQRMSPSNKHAAEAKVSAIVSGGSTNLSGGLFKGLQQQLPQHEVAGWQLLDGDGAGEDPIRAVFLFTDGLANVGLTRADDITAAMTKLFSRPAPAPQQRSIMGALKRLVVPRGAVSASELQSESIVSSQTEGDGGRVIVHTFGFGSDHDADMLQNIAAAANGTYYYIREPEDIPASFADALGGLMSVCAQNIDITIKPAMPGVVINKVHTPFKQFSREGSVSVSMNDMFCEEQKDLILDIRLPSAASDCSQTVLVATVNHLDVLKGELRTTQFSLQVHRAAQVPSDINPDEEVAAHWARIEAAQAMSDAIKLAEQGNLDQAQARMSKARAATLQCRERLDGVLACSAPSAKQTQLNGMLENIAEDLAQCEAAFVSKSEYDQVGSKYTRATLQSHTVQRSHGMQWAPGAAQPGRGGNRTAPGQAPAVRDAMYSNSGQQRLRKQAEAVVLNTDTS